MGLFPCQFSGSNNLIRSESISSSISSQPSLPSIPSLNSSLSHRHDQTPAIHHKCLATLNDESHVFSLCVTTGKVIYSGSSNGEIRAWKQDNNQIQNVVASTSSSVKSLAVLDDKLLISAHQDNKIRIWKIHYDLQSTRKKKYYKCLATLPTLNDRFLRCLSGKNYVKIRRHKKTTWVNHVDTVSALGISKDCSLLYSASWDRAFKIWRTSDFKCLESVTNAHDDAINAIIVHMPPNDDGLFVFTGSADKTIKVWKKQHYKQHLLVATLKKHISAVNALAVSNDGNILYSGGCDRSILVWEREGSGLKGGGGGGGDRQMVVVGALRGHTKAILCLAVVMDLVCSGSADQTVRIWRGNGKSYECLAVLNGHSRPVKCLAGAVDDDNTYMIYSGSLDYDIKVWKVSL